MVVVVHGSGSGSGSDSSSSRQIYNQPVQVISIVFGVTEMASKNQRMYLKKIPAYEDRLLPPCRWLLYLEQHLSFED